VNVSVVIKRRIVPAKDAFQGLENSLMVIRQILWLKRSLFGIVVNITPHIAENFQKIPGNLHAYPVVLLKNKYGSLY
jgi:hypothetical protein